MTCLHCGEKIEKGVYGVHKTCFQKIFKKDPKHTFSEFARMDFDSSSPKKESAYLSSFFVGNYRKYEARLDGEKYILKFQEKNYPELVGVEYICNKIAKSLHIPIPEPIAILNINNEPSFVTKNFMTQQTSPTNLSHLYHYLEKGENNYNVEHLAEVIQRETKSIVEVELFLNVLLFDALIGNHDRHGRNLAIIETPMSKRLSPMIFFICSIVIFSSCSAFFAGVNIASGNLSANFKPAGNLIPQTVPDFWYSFHPVPTKYPLTTHSIGINFVFFTSMDRPFNVDL